MKMLLTGEGPQDCGKEADYHSPKGTWEDGPIQTYLRRVAEEIGLNIEIITVNRAKIKDLRKRKMQPKSYRGLNGEGINAFFLSQAAFDQGCDIVAMYKDSDDDDKDPTSERGCRRKYDRVKGEIVDGLSRGPIDKKLAIVPCKMIESWMMGDMEVFERMYKKKPKTKVSNPELIWGKKDNPNSNYPKNLLDRVLKEYKKSVSRELFVEIAEEQDLDALVETCPISFWDFTQQMWALKD